MSLQDQHLQQALKNAPDKDMVPNDLTRASVLTYANKAVERRHKSWLNRISDLLREWLGAGWHMAGVGSAVATVVVVVVFWHELPDDTMRKVATLSELAEISVADSAMERVSKAVSAEKSLGRASSGAIVPAQEFAEKMVENKAVSDKKPGKPKLASPVVSENRESLASADNLALKNRDSAETIPKAAAIEPEIPAAAAPAHAPMVQDKAVIASAPVAIARTNDVAPTTTKGDLAKEFKAESDASLIMRREAIVAKKSAAKSEVIGSSAPKMAINPHENQVLLTRIKNEGGKALANQDIQVGNLRLLKVEVQAKDFDMLKCPQLLDKTITVDELTGYEIESVGSCDATDSLLKEVEVYNQTMRDWHGNQLR